MLVTKQPVLIEPFNRIREKVVLSLLRSSFDEASQKFKFNVGHIRIIDGQLNDWIPSVVEIEKADFDAVKQALSLEGLSPVEIMDAVENNTLFAIYKHLEVKGIEANLFISFNDLEVYNP